MSPFSKFRKGPLPTVGEEEAVENLPQSDPEKGENEKLEGRDGSQDVATIPSHIAAGIEKSMLRKLDRRLISMVFVLCKNHDAHLQAPYSILTSLDLLSYLDRSNIG